MPNWERRQADTLADAIAKHRSRNPQHTDVNAQLAVLEKAVDALASTVGTTPGALSRHRAQVCSICRRARLYACDVPSGWSDNCALIAVNAAVRSTAQ